MGRSVVGRSRRDISWHSPSVALQRCLATNNRRSPFPCPEIEDGHILYDTFCSSCHGGNAASSALVPDLRYATATTHGLFEQIVRDGAKAKTGMPSFADDLTSAQVRMIQAYVLDRARQSAQAAAATKR